MWDTLLVDCHAATMVGGGYGAVRNAAVAIERGRLAFVGPSKALPGRLDQHARVVRSLEGAWITPGLIDCHTHLVFGGHRAGEWEARLEGATYEEIAAKGGGILSTVRATRAQSEEELARSGAVRARAMAGQGVTTLEIKSGYGLDLENETKMLRAASRIGALANVRVARTFLGAHALPPEIRSDRDAYVELVCETMIPTIAREKLADAVEVFCETIAFTPRETERVFSAAAASGLRVKIHAEQLSDQMGAALAAKFKALSADHLEHLSQSGVAAMARSGTVAVLLPCAFYFLREEKRPPLEALRRASVPMAIATDCNPGTSPCVSPLLALNMACTLFCMTPEEARSGMTDKAARALALEAEIGTLEYGTCAEV